METSKGGTAADKARSVIVTDSLTEAYHAHPGHPAHSHVRQTEMVYFEQELNQSHKGTPPAWELAFGFVMVLAWLALFAAGTLVPTEADRNLLLTGAVGATVGDWLKSFGTVICCYTVTNILFLSVLSSCLGCMTCRWRVTGKLEALMQFYTGLPARRIYLAAVLRGFFLYLTVISGYLVLATEEAVVRTGFAQYIRIAGITSVLAFMVGFDPQIVYRLMGKVNDLANKPLGDGQEPKPAGR